MNPQTPASTPALLSRIAGLSGPGPLLVNFSSPHCGPCASFHPVVDELAEEYAGRLAVLKVNVEAEPEAAESLRIRSVPTVIFFRDGEAVGRSTGALSYGKLKAFVQAHLS